MTAEQLRQAHHDLHTARRGLHAAALLLADIAVSMAEMMKAEANAKHKQSPVSRNGSKRPAGVGAGT
jgi:hypothetical protein